ncbi:MAG TPA: iron ABC transporter permease [Methanoregula sp.]|nr:iron ABC transporter permease [Methanoregula sp.]
MNETTKNSGSAQNVHLLYGEGTKRRLLLIGILVFLLITASIISAGIGTVSISPADTLLAIGEGTRNAAIVVVPSLNNVITITLPAPENPQAGIIVNNFRLPRILLAILTGMSLAVAGTVMQGLLRNPLVSPFTLGMSSAAAFGAAMAIVIGPGIAATLFFLSYESWIVLFAFVSGWLSMLLIYGIARSRGTNQATLILAGVVIGYLFQAGVLALKYLSNNDKLRELTTWLMGGMWGASWDAVILLIPCCIVCFIILESMSWDMNTLAAGDDVAKSMGINVERTRLFGLMVATFVASCCLAFTGIIGFVGLMSPHICRMLIGNDHRYLIPASALLGALILLVSDTVARTILSPVEIPVGIVMYIIGGLFFLYLILRGRGRGLY